MASTAYFGMKCNLQIREKHSLIWIFDRGKSVFFFLVKKDITCEGFHSPSISLLAKVRKKNQTVRK